MTFFRIAQTALAALAFSGIMTVAASAGEHRVYFSTSGSTQLPGCSATSVQNAVQKTVTRAIPSYYGGVRILDLYKIRDTTFRTNVVSPVARRYCSGTAKLSDGSRVRVKYLLEAHAGLFGLGWNVETCLTGRDKWYVYGGSCRSLTAQ
ncbi:hypothetical protein [Labrenzia sp. PHM005]|uniref:hypothetical protein n=1 Tax=Labrenzia sp. PHM005 TaxID=2590016 RepID=UPI001AD8C8BE|nr:hypothetical protein [Labrenzia sp. PHM005]